MATVFRDGEVSVTLTGDLEARMLAIVDHIASTSAKELIAAGEEIAANARREWYGPNGVRRVTGLSGDIVSDLVVDAGRDEIRVRIGSTDTRIAGGKQVALYVRPPGLPTERVEVGRIEYFNAPKDRRHYSMAEGKFYLDKPRGHFSPWANTTNMEALVKRPARLKVKRLGAALRKALGSTYGR